MPKTGTVAHVLCPLLVIAFGEFGRGAWQRLSQEPILSPQGHSGESAGTFNPSVIVRDGKLVMLYRAQDQYGTSRLGYAESTDGIHFERHAQPVLSPETDYEKAGGVQDPRLVEFGDTYYLTYTGYNKKDAQLCLATSKDLIHWQRQGVILPVYKGNWNVGWTKSGAIVPEKIKGRYWMYFLGVDANKKDQNRAGVLLRSRPLDRGNHHADPSNQARQVRFASCRAGTYTADHPNGILLIYNGADDTLVYRTGIALFDQNDPSRLLSRGEQSVFSPEMAWEMIGQVPNVVFVEGIGRKERALPSLLRRRR